MIEIIEFLEKEKDALADQLEELYKLRKRKRITEKEFDTKEKSLLSKREEVKDELRYYKSLTH